jgi:hypothetical protein
VCVCVRVCACVCVCVRVCVCVCVCVCEGTLTRQHSLHNTCVNFVLLLSLKHITNHTNDSRVCTYKRWAGPKPRSVADLIGKLNKTVVEPVKQPAPPTQPIVVITTSTHRQSGPYTKIPITPLDVSPVNAIPNADRDVELGPEPEPLTPRQVSQVNLSQAVACW